VGRQAAGHQEASDTFVMRCVACGEEPDERFRILKPWTWWPDGHGNLLPFCPACAEREFGHRTSLTHDSIQR
jgi:hypothetical protein